MFRQGTARDGEDSNLKEIGPVASEGQLLTTPLGNEVGNGIEGAGIQPRLPHGVMPSSSNALLAAFAHELKTPLTIISGYIEVLHGGALGPLTERQEKALSDAAANCVRLKKFVEEFLSKAARAGREVTLHLEDRDLNKCITDVCGFWRERLIAKNMALYFHPDTAVEPFLFDDDKIQQVISILLDNALKFTPSGGTIWLTSHRTRIELIGVDGQSPDSGDEATHGHSLPAVRVVVADTGPGIPPEFRTEVFQEFFRIPNHGQFEGTGLGLSIAERLIHAHSGKIWVEGEPGAGTRVSFLLPVQHNTDAIGKPVGSG